MLNAYSKNLTLAAGQAVPFNSIALLKGNTAIMSGSTAVQINKCGVYSVCAVVSGLPAVAGDITLTMTKNGAAQPQATFTYQDALTTTGVVLPICTLVQVRDDNGPCCCQSPTVLQFSVSAGLTEADATIVVTKIC